MSVRINAGFDLFSKQPLDSRFVFDTKANMESLAKHKLYNGLISYCAEDNLFYKLINDNWQELDQSREAINKPVNKDELNALTNIADGSVIFVKDEHKFYYYVSPVDPEDVQSNEGFQLFRYNADEIIYTDINIDEPVDNVQDAIDRNIANITSNKDNIQLISDKLSTLNYKATVEQSGDLIDTYNDGDVVVVLNKTEVEGVTSIDPKIQVYFDGNWVPLIKEIEDTEEVSSEIVIIVSDNRELGNGVLLVVDDSVEIVGENEIKLSDLTNKFPDLSGVQVGTKVQVKRNTVDLTDINERLTELENRKYNEATLFATRNYTGDLSAGEVVDGGVVKDVVDIVTDDSIEISVDNANELLEEGETPVSAGEKVLYFQVVVTLKDLAEKIDNFETTIVWKEI